MRKLEGKVALVTGSSRGMGAAIAQRLVADRASTVVNYVKAKQQGEAVVERARRAAVRAVVVNAAGGETAAKRLVQEVATHLPADGGRAINISSLAAMQALPMMSVYAAAKGAVEATTHVWAKEIARIGIPVIADVATFPRVTGGALGDGAVARRTGG